MIETTIPILTFSLLLFLVIAFRTKRDNFSTLFSGSNGAIFAAIFMFITLTSIYLNKQEAWITDLLKVVTGIIVGVATTSVYQKKQENSVEIAGSQFDKNTKIAGRDINEKIENLQGNIQELKDSVINQYGSIAHSIAGTLSPSKKVIEYLFISSFDTEHEPLNEVAKLSKELEKENWHFYSVNNSFFSKEGYTIVFQRDRDPKDDDRKISNGKYANRYYYGLEAVELGYK